MRKILAGLLFAAIIAITQAIPGTQLEAPAFRSVRAQDAPTFEPAECGFYVPAGQTTECGYLTVPEDRQNPDSPMIRLHIATFKSLNENPQPDPVVYVMSAPGGGPGSNESSVLSQFAEVEFIMFLDQHDLIVMDQRGTGYSEPKLDCPAISRLNNDTLVEPQDPASVVEALSSTIETCQSEMADANLAAYNSAAVAADLSDLRLAMGYDAWNIYAVGYGARAALQVMQNYPDGLRSVVLDSPIPPQVNWIEDFPGNVQDSLNELFEACANDEECNTDYPNVESDLYATVAALNENPVMIKGTRPDTGQPFDMLLDGQRFLNTIRYAFYFQDNLQFMPFVISSAASGRYALVRLLAEQIITNASLVSEVAQYAMLCNEDIPFSSRAAYEASLADVHAELQPYLSIEGNLAFELCEAWGLPAPDESVKAPVTSDIPTMILAGQYDSISIPAYAESIAETLSNHYLLTFPDQTFRPLFSLDPCPLVVAYDFLVDPSAAPTAECATAMTGVNFISQLDMLGIEAQITSSQPQ